jgi:hypothetical protein
MTRPFHHSIRQVFHQPLMQNFESALQSVAWHPKTATLSGLFTLAGSAGSPTSTGRAKLIALVETDIFRLFP